MTSEDISELLNRLAIFPKPYPRTLEGVVKLIEHQRWRAIKGENENCAEAARWCLGKVHTYASENADMYKAQEHALEQAAAAIRARVKQ